MRVDGGEEAVGPGEADCVFFYEGLFVLLVLLVGVVDEAWIAIHGTGQPEHVISRADHDGRMCGCGAALPYPL